MVFFGKELPVEGIFVVFKDVESQPGAAHRPYACGAAFALRSRIAPYIGMAVAYEALADTVHFLCGDSAVAAYALKQVEKGKMTFGQVAALTTTSMSSLRLLTLSPRAEFMAVHRSSALHGRSMKREAPFSVT